MNVKIGEKCIIVINVGKILTYEAIITSVDNNFISFTDKNKNSFTYNNNVVVSIVPQKGGKTNA